MKKIDIVLRILLLLLCVSPILGSLGVFPAPTREMYTSDAAFSFINGLMGTYVTAVMSIVFALIFAFTLKNRMAIAALLLLPLTVCIVAFHATLDGGLLKPGASMALVLAAINIYFLWRNRGRYRPLLDRSN